MPLYIPIISPALKALSSFFEGLPGSEWITDAAASGGKSVV